MNKEEIMALQEYDLNKAIVENIFGYKHYVGSEVPKEHYCMGAKGDQEIWLHEKGRYCKWCGDMPNYYNNIEDAWNIHLDMLGRYFSSRRKYYQALQDIATNQSKLESGMMIMYPDVFTVLKNNMSESICRAALMVIFDCVE